ncbi:MAG: ribonuclease III [Sedimenticola sp.]|nr:ribonuclease III [Sedimenticola sp.]
MREPVERLCQAIGYRFNDPGLTETALTHRSAGSSNNERLEFLGDAILGFVIADYLYSHYGNADEGELSRLRAALVKGDSLAEIAQSLQLGMYLNLGPGELRSGGHSRASILADAVEALLAAVYLDGGYPAAREVILRLFEEKLAGLGRKSRQKDPKTRLQELLQAKKTALPVYTILSITGEQHEQRFRVSCKVEELDLESEGTGSSRRKAEQNAASQLLREIERV